MSNNKIYWHFARVDEHGVPRLGYGDGREIRVGETLTVEGEPQLCEHGLHASERILDALVYAEGSVICKVTLGGIVIEDDDKAVATERTVIAMTGDDVSAAEVQATSFEKMDFAGHLYDLIKNETGGIVIDMLRGGVWYNRNDTTGQDFTTAAARGCGSGDTIQWVAVGPVRTVVVAPGQNLILFRGAFNQPGDIACMGDYKDIEVARIMATPAVVRQVEDYKGRQGNAKWNWNIGDGLARTFAWSGWDYLSFFAVRSSGSGVPTTTSMFFFVPEDFMDVTCVVTQGRKSCLITQTEPGF